MKKSRQQDLRDKAERLLTPENGSDSQSLSDEQREIVHELQVHQIELELQNEELRQAQEALEKSRARYLQLYHNAPVGYVVLDYAGIIVEANTVFAGMLGQETVQLHGTVFMDYLHDDDQVIFRARWKTFFKNPGNKQLEMRIGPSRNSLRHVTLSAVINNVPDTAKGRGSEQLLVAITDITDRKLLEKEQAALQAKQSKLEKTASLHRMAGAIAHNLNNQLAVVLGNLELAFSDVAVGSGVAQFLRSAMQGAFKASDTGGMMLRYLGQEAAEKEMIDLVEICDRELQLLQHAKPEGARLSKQSPAHPIRVHANARQIQQIVVNLVTNAWEAMEGESIAIEISIETVPGDAISETFRFPFDWYPDRKKYACITVQDNGCGIEAINMEKLFDPFYSDKFTGRGMGLPVVLGLLQAHKGGGTVNSEKGKGSVFHVYLPLADR
ncbi:MAG: ATP-binding protein [Desulfobacteraceae bacterium]